MTVRICALLIIVLAVTSCMRSDREHIPASEKLLGVLPYDWMKPRAYRDRPYDGMPAGNSSYAQGYQAGCQTMNSAMGEGLYRIRGPKIEPDKLTSDAWYLRGYQDGTHVCTFQIDWEVH